jgi:hypothetical protein
MNTKHLRLLKRHPSSTLLVALLAILSHSFVMAQGVVYIDPSYTGSTQNGSISTPYKSWSQVSWTNGKTYLQKAGTTFTTSGYIDLSGRSSITLGSYGEGAKPKIISSGGSTTKVVKITSGSNNTVRDLDLSSSTGQATCAVIIDGTNSSNNVIDNCILRDVQWGIRVLTTGAGNKILNSVVYNTQDDGIYIKNVPDIEIGYCHIYNVNLKYNVNTDESYSAGDNIQIGSTNNHNFYIHHNILDHSSTGNKFCFIAYGVNYTGIFEYNTLIGNRTKNTSCIYLHPTTGSVTVRYNSISDGNYGMYTYVSDLKVYYNKFIQNKVAISVLTNYNLRAENNVFYNQTSNVITSGSNTSIVSKNNIFYIVSGTKVYTTSGSVVSNNNTFNTQSSGFLNGHSTLVAWRSATGQDQNSILADPKFVNPSNRDFTLQPTSPCINAGSNCGYNKDFFGTTVPQGQSADIGHFEYPSTNVNNPPVVNNQNFNVAENSSANTTVGTVTATDPDNNQTLTYSIIDGNANNAFSINASTGVLAVQNSQALNFEAIQQFALQVKVADQGGLYAVATVTVNVQNVNEQPVINSQIFSIAENATVNTVVGTISATDPDNNQTLSYSITGGNSNSAFSVNASTGVLTVQNSQALNYEAIQQFAFQIKVADQGDLYAVATITVNVQNGNEQPIINNQIFSIVENATVNTVVGTISATDPDNNQTLSYSITGGNTNNTFSINASTGVLAVQNSAALNYEAIQQFALQIKVADQGDLYAVATITVNVQNVNEQPVINSQTFSITENASVNSVVGTVSASDPDNNQTLSFSLISGNVNNAFSLNASTGVLSVQNAQAINYTAIQQFSLLVQVSDQGSLSANATIIVNVQEVNEHPIISNQTFSIAENSAVNSVVGTVLATDPDDNQTLTYSITGGNVNNTFSLNSSNGELIIQNSQSLNYESNQQFSLQVSVTDQGGLSGSATITINIQDVNEKPEVDDQGYNVPNTSVNGTLIGQINATDPDNGQSLNYTITAGNSLTAFSLNSNDGTIKVNNATALNSYSQFVLTVKVSDNGQPTESAFCNVTINIISSNSAPLIQEQVFTINENPVNGAQIGQLVAADADQGQSLTFEIISGNEDNFVNCTPQGLLTVLNTGFFNYEANSSLEIIVRVSDNGNPVMSSEAVVIFEINDINESPVIQPYQSFTVYTNTPQGCVVGRVIATDPDINQQLTYQIAAGNIQNILGIKAQTGDLYILNASALRRLPTRYVRLTIKVTDSGNPSLSSTRTVNIHFIRVNSMTKEMNISPTVEISECNVYPNPSTDGLFTISLNNESENLTYMITDMNGAGQYYKQSNEEKNVINLSHLPKGMYILIIKQGDSTITKKLIYQ